MRLIGNSGNDRVVDALRKVLPSAGRLDVASSEFSLFAYSEIRDLLANAVASIIGKKEERAAASLFAPGGTHALRGEFLGINDFEVATFLVVLPEGKA